MPKQCFIGSLPIFSVAKQRTFSKQWFHHQRNYDNQRDTFPSCDNEDKACETLLSDLVKLFTSS